MKIETEIKEEFVENEVVLKIENFEDVHHFISIQDELPFESSRNTNSGTQVNKSISKHENNMRKQESESKQAYSQIEKVLLTSIIDKYKNIIENKRTNAADNKKKKEAWLKIQASYNSQPEVDCQRTAHQLKRCWENLKQRKRRNHTAKGNSYLAADSEPPVKITKSDQELDELVSSVASFSDFEIDCPFDSNATYQQKDTPSISTDRHDEESVVEVTCEATPAREKLSHLKTYLNTEKNLRIQKLTESIEQQKALQDVKLEAAVAERNARKYEEEYWKKKLESL